MAFNALACFGPLAAHIRSGCPVLWLISTLSILVSNRQPSHHRTAKVLERIQEAKAETSNDDGDDLLLDLLLIFEY